ncbi:MAG: MerR family transcriptional regulator [Candidatus Hydrogenedentes bacterium]|nr:MerR family transcriptional regulator [Candidatus Hydrogenedentota bacterium]
MPTSPERRLRISEVSEMTGVAIHLLRQWEEKIPQLKPKRDRANRRYYLEKDIEIVRRVKHLVRHEKMALDGVRLRIAQEMHGEGRPRTKQEAIDLVDRIEGEVRAMLALIGPKKKD